MWILEKVVSSHSWYLLYKTTSGEASVESELARLWPCQHLTWLARADKLIAYTDRLPGVWSQDPESCLMSR